MSDETVMIRRVRRSLLLLLLFVCTDGVVSAQSIEIKIVNGRDGRPMAGTCVNLWVGTERKTAMAIPTDENGVARFRLTANDGEVDIHNRWRNCGEFGLIDPIVKYSDSFRIYKGYVLCESRTPGHSWLAIKDYSTQQVVQNGIATVNTCGKATASPKRGEVILFVRPLTWWEKFWGRLWE
jgi:hypothetical protein